MSLPSNIGAYPDCERLFEAAQSDRVGTRACVGAYDAANVLRARLNQYRKLHRRENALIYPDPHHPQHGKSVYDEFAVQIKQDTDGEYWIYLSRRSASLLSVEPLSSLTEHN